ncbi:class I SAM-dependent methyltransferase [Rhizobium sp. P32RR-XVIII]|uniref:class I SAM-dependent methyltransferase n=1 Tax=Rhizobium sp. P32RR-XVIII TaxID=2726738 RepID=UPI001FEEC788|nr:class I SAM-dependent methyltransferase [Rhizobium sp. P32RR-XVIII]
MPNDPTRSHLVAMKGDGFYNRHSAMQATGIAALLSLWETACRTVVVGEGPLTIVDYGSSQGRNSMAPMRVAIKTLRFRSGPSVPIEVVHTDLPSNDFSALFEALVSEPGSYMNDASDVFPSAIGRSYFEQLLSPQRVHLGWTTWALQWMSATTIEAPDHILAGMSATPTVVSAVKEQQARDWERFLTLRSREMRPGAKLLAGFTARTATVTGWEWLLGELWSAVCDMRTDGRLSEREQNHLTIPIGLRTLEEIQQPFIQAENFADLELEHLDLVKLTDPCWEQFERSGDALAFAKHHGDMTQAWCGPMIASLIEPSREQAALVTELFTRFERRLSECPRPHEPYMAAVVLSKRA